MRGFIFLSILSCGFGTLDEKELLPEVSGEQRPNQNMVHSNYSLQIKTDKTEITQIHTNSRKKRFAVTSALIIIGLVASASSLTVTTMDLASDGEIFYPDIRKHKDNIENYSKLIKVYLPILTQKVEQMKVKVNQIETISQKLQRWDALMSGIKAIFAKHDLTYSYTGNIQVIEELEELLSIPPEIKTTLPVSTLMLTTGSWVLVVGTSVKSIVQITSGAVATMSVTSSVIVGGFSVIAVPVSGLFIGITVDEARKKRDRYAKIAVRTKNQWDKILESNRKMSDVTTKQIKPFLRKAKSKMEEMFSDELNISCNMDLDVDALIHALTLVNEHWGNILAQFITLDEQWTQIRYQIDDGISAGLSASQIYQRTLERHQNQGQFILKAMKNAGFPQSTLGRWSKWTDITKCQKKSCGISTKTERRDCLSSSCVGNTEKKNICSIDYQQAKQCPEFKEIVKAERFAPYLKEIRGVCNLPKYGRKR